MKVVVIGGAGLVGAQVVSKLVDKGHEALAASPRSGVNTVTGEGLAQALAGADVVLDVTNSPAYDDDAMLDFFTRSTINQLNAEKVAGVSHHVAVTVIGAERNPDSGYSRAKLAQEHEVQAGSVPYTIVRPTQFFEFLGGIADAGQDGDIVRLSSAMVQPVSSNDLADALVEIILGKPANTTMEIAGPERFQLNDVVSRYLATVGDRRSIVADDDAPYFGGVLAKDGLLPHGPAIIGATHFAEWLKSCLR